MFYDSSLSRVAYRLQTKTVINDKPRWTKSPIWFQNHWGSVLDAQMLTGSEYLINPPTDSYSHPGPGSEISARTH